MSFSSKYTKNKCKRCNRTFHRRQKQTFCSNECSASYKSIRHGVEKRVDEIRRDRRERALENKYEDSFLLGLTDKKIKKSIKNQYGLSSPPQEIIDLKKMNIKRKRVLRNDS